MTDSDSESKNEVASSNNIIDEFFNIALAIDNLCFCPPDNFIPFSPIRVSYLFEVFLQNLELQQIYMRLLFLHPRQMRYHIRC